MRTRYDLAKDSNTLSGNNTYYKDICTIPMNKFKYTKSPIEYSIQSPDTTRIDLLMARRYGVSEFDDFILWLNAIEDPHTLEVADTINLPTKSDLEFFYYKHIQ